MLPALALTVLLSPASRAQNTNLETVDYTTPTKKLDSKAFPKFNDDLEFQDMALAIQRQLDRFKTKDLTGTITLGGTKYPAAKARTSLQVFLKLAANFQSCRKLHSSSHCLSLFNAQLEARFNVFAPDLKQGDPRYGDPLNSLFTGYATEPISGSSVPDQTFSHAVYAMPADPVDRAMPRDAIDFHGALSGKKLELTYAENLFDLYLLHIEGGGYVTAFENGAVVNFFLSYDGTNGQHFQWLSKYMMSKGYITNPSSGAQRKFLREHPEKWEEIYSQCPSYVFFKVSTTPPQGAEEIPVTPGRTLATDNQLYAFKGLLAFVDSQRPVDTGTYDLEQEDATKIPFQPFSRFFLDQDTGGAITGKGRADIYFGLDGYAQYAATYQQQNGNIYFLLLK